MNIIEQLKYILAATKWSQEKLAAELSVSFVTLNSWINAHSTPRAQSKQKISDLYFFVSGDDEVNRFNLSQLKKSVMKKHLTIKTLLANQKLLDNLTVGFTFHTNATEGSTMTLKDVEGVVFDNKVLTNRSAIEQREAINHNEALKYLLHNLAQAGSKFVFSEDILLDTHQRLMHGIISNSGVYRNHSVRIVGANVPLANFIKIPELIKVLLNEINEETMDPLNLLARTHAKFEQIHPFSDGNGRIGRLLMFVKAIQLGIVPPIIRNVRRMAYYKFLELAQKDGHYDPLENFLCEEIVYADSQIAKFL